MPVSYDAYAKCTRGKRHIQEQTSDAHRDGNMKNKEGGSVELKAPVVVTWLDWAWAGKEYVSLKMWP